MLGRELPILFRDPDGTAWSGTIDLLYRETDGALVVADYKTGREPDGGAPETYRAQLCDLRARHREGLPGRAGDRARADLAAQRPARAAPARIGRMSFDDIAIESLRRKRGEKWTQYPADVLAAWVADMDFPVAEPIARYLAEMVDRQRPRLPDQPDASRAADGLRQARARALRLAGRSAPRPGDHRRRAGLLHRDPHLLAAGRRAWSYRRPVYPPFLNVDRRARPAPDREPARAGPRGYEIDFDDLRAKADAGARILLLCNPQNPTGRAFTRAELERIAELAIERDLIVISDEIHADLVFPGHRHIPIATLGPEIAARTITLTSATKTFNIAGLRCAVAIFGSPS